MLVNGKNERNDVRTFKLWSNVFNIVSIESSNVPTLINSILFAKSKNCQNYYYI